MRYRNRWLGIALSTCLSFTGVGAGCGSDEDAGGGNDRSPESEPSPPNEGDVPEASQDEPPCVISADCPTGSHCDLGECIQECSTEAPCPEGLICSERARCVESAEQDQDPEPPTTWAGDLTAEPSYLSLSDRDSHVDLVLRASSNSPVRYRVQSLSPYLVVEQERGEFTGSTSLRLIVDPTRISDRDVAGSIKVFTTLGNVAVGSSLKVGVTGSYQGMLRYDGGPVPLGDARIALELVESQGSVSARVDGRRSLLFPDTGGGATTGTGTYTDSEGVVLVLSQRIDSTFGGDRNHFGRDVGRKVVLRLGADANGQLTGTFEETLHGLFVQPVRLTGTVALEHRSTAEAPSFVVADPPSMPPAPNAQHTLSPEEVFGWADGSCTEVVCGAQPCELSSKVQFLEWMYYQPLENSVAHKNGVDAFQTLSSDCTEALGLSSLQAYSASTKRCGLPVPLACGLSLASQGASADTDNGRAFGRLMRESLAAPLLVAKNDVVEALQASLTQGASAEQASYDHALSVLSPSARWVLQPSVLEYMRSMTPVAAKGDPPSDSETQNGSYPSARALADLLRTMAIIDGERSRVGAAAKWSDAPNHAKLAQERGLLAFLESAALAEVLNAWGESPESVSATLTGALTPLDRGFAAASQGATAFGIPDAFVPFVYRPEDVGKGATNFEQMLAIVNTQLGQHAKLELAYRENQRAFELNEQELRAEITAVQDKYDSELRALCGPQFDPEDVIGPESWDACGEGNTGRIGEMMLEIDQTMAGLQSAESRIQGMKDKIEIDENTLARTQKVHTDTLRFIDSNGKQLEAITLAEATITAEQKFLEVAANSNIANLGAPVGLAAMDAMLELMRGQLEMQRQRLQTAQTMRFEQANAQIELINGMANIQKSVIDLAQLGVDMQQDCIAVVLAKLRVRNAIDQARDLYDSRQQQLALITSGLNPTNDPSYRLMRDELALELIRSRERVQRQMFLAGRALAYEVDQPMPTVGGAVIEATNELKLSNLASCLQSIHTDHRIAYGSPQTYTTKVSLREMLGVTGPRIDEVTGEELTEGELFRRLLLRNENFDGDGGVAIEMSTNLQNDNGLWSTNVCLDRVTGIRAQVVGDFLGDNDARVLLSLEGGGVLRGCEGDALHPWAFGAEGSSAATVVANVQAGVNSFGEAAANTSLRGMPVAAPTWRVLIPGGASEPANADLDITQIEDIVLEVTHEALPRKNATYTIDTSCLGGM